MLVEDLSKLGMSIIREVNIPEAWMGKFDLIPEEEIINFFKDRVDPEIELRPLILPYWLYNALIERNLLKTINKYYGKISVLANTFIIK